MVIFLARPVKIDERFNLVSFMSLQMSHSLLWRDYLHGTCAVTEQARKTNQRRRRWLYVLSIYLQQEFPVIEPIKATYNIDRLHFRYVVTENDTE